MSQGKCERCNEQTEKPSYSNVFLYSVSVNVEHAILNVNLENDSENSMILAFSLGKIGMQYVVNKALCILFFFFFFYEIFSDTFYGLGISITGIVIRSLWRSSVHL